MQITDPVADMLTRIRNAGSAKHDTVDVPASKMKRAIAQILMDEGYILSLIHISKLGKTVVFADDDNVVGENAKAAVAAMNNGDVVLLQNTRFRKEETKNCLLYTSRCV